MSAYKKSNFRADINGLRAIAVLAVVIYHFEWFGLEGGFIGVDIFFVISGYLMTTIIVKQLNSQRFNLLNFYLSRARRILPALSVMLLIVMLFAWYFVNSLDYEQIGKHAVASISFLSNIVYWLEAGYFDTASHHKWFLHTWSLSVEWQFYFLYPLVLMGLYKLLSHRPQLIKLALLILCLCSLILSIILTHQWKNASFFLISTRAWEMLLGGLVFLFPVSLSLRRQQIIQIVALTTLFFSFLLIKSVYTWPGFLTLLPVFATASLILCNPHKPIFTSHVLAQWLGNISYSVYLWHWPIIIWLKYVDLFYHPPALFFGFFCTFLFGYLSYQFIEMPWREKIDKTRYFDFKNLLLICLTMITLLSGFSIQYFKGFSTRIGEKALLAAAEAKNKNPRIKECLINSGTKVPGCHYGQKQLPVDAIVLGDSHAMSLMSAVYASHPKTDKHMMFFGYIACATIQGAKLRNPPDGFGCAESLEQIINTIVNDYPKVPLIIINRFAGYLFNQSNPDKITFKGPIIYFDQPFETITPVLIKQYRQHFYTTLCELSHNRPTYIVESIPEMGRDTPRFMEKQLIAGLAAKDISVPIKQHYDRSHLSNQIIRDASKICTAIALDPTPYLCNDTVCFGSQDGRPLYFDGDHLSEYGNKKLVPLFQSIW